MSNIQRVLAAVDYSEASRAAFNHALAISRRHDAELLAIHAVPTDRAFNWHASERMSLIESLRLAADEAGVRFRPAVQHGDPARVIMLHADARGADVIVMGSSKRTGLDRWRFGSVAETVVRKAKQAVLVIPADPSASSSSAPAWSILGIPAATSRT